MFTEELCIKDLTINVYTAISKYENNDLNNN